MAAIFKMANKDLRILFRDKLGAFFIVGFPILMGLFFGLIMGRSSGGSGSAKMKIVVVDQDQTKTSKKFLASLTSNGSLRVETIDPLLIDEALAEQTLSPEEKDQKRHELTVEAARQSVRRGQRVGMIVLPKGFGERAGIFWGDPPRLQVGMDPSRAAEAGMVQGFIMEAIGALAGDRFAEPSQLKSSIANARDDFQEEEGVDPETSALMLDFFGSVDNMLDRMDELQGNEEASAQVNSNGGFQFANIEAIDISRQFDPRSRAGQLQKLKSRWDISFPQAMMWGIMGCVAGFSTSIARENSKGTMLRLQVAPVSRFQILAGKALACFMTVVGVVIMLVVVGFLLGMRPGNYFLLGIATVCIAFCFVGIMMTFSVLGKTEQAVSGSGWAINMIMAMLGGGMVPVMFMPDFMQTASVLSPIKWGILAIEGSIWRGFSPGEMLFPCGVLLAVGTVGLLIGTVILNRRQ